MASTIARSSLGIPYTSTFDEDVHLEEDKYWDDVEGVWRAANQVSWYLKKVRFILA